MEYIIVCLPSIIVIIVAAFILMCQQINFLTKDVKLLDEKVSKQHLDIIDFKYKIQSLERSKGEKP